MYEFYVKNYTYNYDRKYANTSIDIKENRLSLYTQLYEAVDQVEMFYELQITGFPASFKKTTNLCQFFEDPRSDRLIKYLYQEIVKAGLKITKCPIEPVNLKYSS